MTVSFKPKISLAAWDNLCSILSMLLHLEFTIYFSTIFVGSFDIGVSREFFPNEVRSPEIMNLAS
jgi:hypothetical protein